MAVGMDSIAITIAHPMQRIVIFGNSGSGKSTLAIRLAGAIGCPHFDLDTIAWEPTTPPRRRALDASAAALTRFMDAHADWIVEGCYADLLAVAAARASRLVFLNPGVEACIANARARPFEPHKYSTPEAQDANLAMLIDWIRAYETRSDEFSLAAHRRLYHEFAGEKIELASNAASAVALR